MIADLIDMVIWVDRKRLNTPWAVPKAIFLLKPQTTPTGLAVAQDRASRKVAAPALAQDQVRSNMEVFLGLSGTSIF